MTVKREHPNEYQLNSWRGIHIQWSNLARENVTYAKTRMFFFRVRGLDLSGRVVVGYWGISMRIEKTQKPLTSLRVQTMADYNKFSVGIPQKSDLMLFLSLMLIAGMSS